MKRFQSEDMAELNPQDAANLGIEEGQMLKVTSRRGQVVARAKLTESSPPGVVFMTFHFPDTVTNLLTNSAFDPIAKIPELKVCAVRVEKVEA